MSWISNMSGLGKTVTAGRRCIGTVVIIIGVILCIPSILGFAYASNKYDEAKIGEFPGTATPNVGGSATINIPDMMKAGHNYDIVVSMSAVGPYTNERTGQITVSAVISGDISRSAVLSASGFNSTTSRSQTFELEDNLAADSEITIVFNITSINNVSSVTVEVKLYEDPNRWLIGLVNNVATILLIPGIIVICCGCCIAPPQKK